MARKLLTVLMMLAMLGPLSAISGCNTVAGAGKDIERGGEKVEGPRVTSSARCDFSATARGRHGTGPRTSRRWRAY